MIKKDSSREILGVLIKRTNKLHSMYAKGKCLSECLGYAKEKNMKFLNNKFYSTTRLASSSYPQFESIYESYEALVGVFTLIRETEDEEEDL